MHDVWHLALRYTAFSGITFLYCSVSLLWIGAEIFQSSRFGRHSLRWCGLYLGNHLVSGFLFSFTCYSEIRRPFQPLPYSRLSHCAAWTQVVNLIKDSGCHWNNLQNWVDGNYCDLVASLSFNFFFLFFLFVCFLSCDLTSSRVELTHSFFRVLNCVWFGTYIAPLILKLISCLNKKKTGSIHS